MQSITTIEGGLSFLILLAVPLLVVLVCWLRTEKRQLAIKVSDYEQVNADLLRELENIRRGSDQQLQIMGGKLDAAKLKDDQVAQAKSEFLANMSHEIRTPLNGVMGMLDLLRNTALDTHQDKFVTTAYNSANSLLNIISSILDYSKLMSGTLSIRNDVFDVRKVLQDDSIFSAIDIAGKNLKFDCLVSREVPSTLFGDGKHLRQIVINLVSNAVKFTEAGGITLTVSLAAMDDSKAQLRVEVKDTGIGIDGSKLEGLFEPFIQRDNSSTRKYGGAGLGLTVTKTLIELMGGEIGATSTEGQGSTFWFSLWFDLAAPAEEIVKTFVGEGFCVLIVDDNKTNLLVAEAMIRKFGLRSEIAIDGSEALKVLAAKQCDLVLMDCQMPVMDGYTATREIRLLEKASGQANHLPIIALTAHALEGDREACLEAGMDDYLTKPFLLSELESMLQRWLRGPVKPPSTHPSYKFGAPQTGQ